MTMKKTPRKTQQAGQSSTIREATTYDYTHINISGAGVQHRANLLSFHWGN